jgi:hypothetical protein
METRQQPRRRSRLRGYGAAFFGTLAPLFPTRHGGITIAGIAVGSAGFAVVVLFNCSAVVHSSGTTMEKEEGRKRRGKRGEEGREQY